MQRNSALQAKTATNRTPREINRSFLFDLIRRHNPISRADLARLSGLQRSTVSLIVEELLRDRWILEGETGKLPRGRRPTFLHLNLRRSVLAIDIHPARTTIGVVDIGGNVISRSVVRIPEDPPKAIHAIIAAARKTIAAHPGHSFEGIGICLPGRVDLENRKLLFAPNLRWPVLTIKPRIERATSLPVEMDNVANACALAEVRFDSSDIQHDRVVVNVDEGIGTGIFANGELVRGDKGMAGEFGHVQLDPSGPACACGSRGCWETLASCTAALRYYAKTSEEIPESDNVVQDFQRLIRLARSGDQHAIRALRKAATFLGRGARMIATTLAPREIVIVGDMTQVWDICGPVAQAEVNNHFLSRSTTLRPAAEGESTRLRSAAALVLSSGII